MKNKPGNKKKTLFLSPRKFLEVPSKLVYYDSVIDFQKIMKVTIIF